MCRLVGPGNHHPGVYGSDLGFGFVHPQAQPGDASPDSRLVVLFGDTETTDSSVCDYPPRASDDLQATLPVRRPDVLSAGEPTGDADQACAELALPESQSEDPTAWPPIRLFPDAGERVAPLDTSLGRTPVTGFSDGEHTFGIFLRAELEGCDRAAQCPAGMICSADPSYDGQSIGVCDPVFALTRDPPPSLCLSDADCGNERTCAPAARGFCMATEPFRVEGSDGTVTPPWFEDDARRAVAQPMYVASAFWPEQPTDYATGHRFVTNRFVNVTARTVAHFDPDDPSRNDYRPGTHTLLLWGRAAFLARKRWQPLVFLLHQPLDGLLQEDGRIAWAPRFFAGYREDGAPRWSEREEDALPVYGAEQAAGAENGAVEQAEFGLVNQMSLSFVPALQRWVMLYGGSLPGFLFYDPATDMELDPVYPQPVKGSVYLRSAAHPWGRARSDSPASEDWSSAEPVLSRETAARYLGCDTEPPMLPGCTDEHDLHRPLQLLLAVDGYREITPADYAEITRICLEGDALRNLQYMLSGDTSGHLYGASILEPWTADVTDEIEDLAPDERAVELYWNVSTWNPYQVVLVKTQLRAL